MNAGVARALEKPEVLRRMQRAAAQGSKAYQNDDYKDATQDAILNVLQNNDSPDSPEPWLASVAFNQGKVFRRARNSHVKIVRKNSYAKRYGRGRLSSLGDESTRTLRAKDPDPEELLLSKEQDQVRQKRADELRQAVSSLEPKYRSAAYGMLAGLSHDQHAKELGMSLAGVQSLRWRTINMLRQQMGAPTSDAFRRSKYNYKA